jgi:WD40 repeat protein
MAIHPLLDLMVTGGRDSTARVWDMRTKQQIFALTGNQDRENNILERSVRILFARQDNHDANAYSKGICRGVGWLYRTITTQTHIPKEFAEVDRTITTQTHIPKEFAEVLVGWTGPSRRKRIFQRNLQRWINNNLYKNITKY